MASRFQSRIIVIVLDVFKTIFNFQNIVDKTNWLGYSTNFKVGEQSGSVLR